MIKPGDLVMLADEKWVVPGALTALKYFKRMQDQYGGKPMLVIETQKKKNPPHITVAGYDQSIVVMVDGGKQVFTASLLKVVNEEG